jgi:enterochelin esterase family protein
MRRILIAMLLASSSAPGSVAAQTIQALLSRVESAAPLERAAIVDSFMASVPAFPLIEQDTLATFLYRGNASAVNVPGDPNGWNSSGLPMARLSTTDLFYCTAHFPRDARLDYKYLLNGSTWILDPLNHYQVMGGFGPNSELRMPGYVPPPEIVFDPSIPHGRLFDTTFYSTNLGNSRPVRVYLPPGYDDSPDSQGMILFHDGLEYITLAYAQNTLDFLIHHRRIRTVIGVFVPPVNRTPEYFNSQRTAFTAFVIQELIPWVDARFRTIRSADQRATLGASYGGHIAIWLGYSNPQVFGNVAGQSSVIPAEAANGIQNGSKLPVKFYLDMGTYESGLLGGCRQFVQTLQNGGYDVTYREYPEAHSWGSWRAHIDNALEKFFPGEALGVDQSLLTPGTMGLEQNYPNPFNPSSTIRYQIAAVSNVRLAVYDLLGREVAVLVDEQKASGRYEVKFDARPNARRATGTSTGLASGVYICRLIADGRAQTRKMLLMQ